MERRKHLRIATKDEVVVTGLCHFPASQRGVTRDFSGRGICVILPRPLPANEPVQIEWQQSLLLGEVCRCDVLPEGFAVGIELDQVVSMTNQLSRLMQTIQSHQVEVPAGKPF